MSAILFLMFLAFLIGGIGYVAYKSYNEEKLQGLGVGLLLVALSVLPFLGFVSYSPVDSGHVGVVTRMGKVTGMVGPGPHFVTPFVSKVDSITTRTLVVKPSEDASSLDLQQVHIEVTLAYHFDANYMDWLYSKLFDATPNSAETKVIIPAILESIKASTAKYTVQQLVEQRAKVRDDIENAVKVLLVPYHIVAENTSITDFRFSNEFEKSIEQKQVAVQDAEKAQNKLKQIQFEAEQRVAAAQGEAAALKAQKEQITPELLQLRMIEMLKDKWDGHLPESYFGGTAPLPIVDAFKNSHIEKK